MKQLSFILIAFILVFAHGWALPVDSLGTKKGNNIVSETKGITQVMDESHSVKFDTAIYVNPISLDFGQVVLGKTVTKTFRVRAFGLAGPLKLDLLLTRSLPSREKFTVTPTLITASQAARGATVTVTYAPNELGEDGGHIVISGSGVASKSVNLSGTGIATSPSPTITVNPTTVVIPEDSNSGKFTVIGSNLTGPLTIKCNNSNFTVSPTTITVAGAAAGKTVTVTCKPTASGNCSGTITISGGGADSKTIRVIKRYAAPEITVTPATLYFGTVVKGNSYTKSFMLTGTHLTGSLIVKSSNSNFIVTPTSIPKADAANGVMVTVIYKPSTTGDHAGTITISGGGASSKTIAVIGKCVAPTPIITVTPTTLDFGTVVKGTTCSKTFMVKASHLTNNLTISSTNNSCFTFSPSTITVSEAEAGKIVVVTYRPYSVGTHSATLTISCGGVSKTIILRGRCVDGSVMMGMIESDEENAEYCDLDSHEALMQSTDAIATSVNELSMDVKIYAEGQNIVIESAVEQSAIISDITGHAQSVNLQVGRNEIPVNCGGFQIVRVGHQTAKLMLR